MTAVQTQRRMLCELEEREVERGWGREVGWLRRKRGGGGGGWGRTKWFSILHFPEVQILYQQCHAQVREKKKRKKVSDIMVYR